jgi:hypothetical protein
MSKEKDKVVEVKVKDGEGEKTVKIVVKRPQSAVMSQAQRVSAKAWTDCVRDGIMTKKELSKFMKEQGIWDKGKDVEQDKISADIIALEKKLYVGDSKNAKVKASEAKNIAIEMRKKRNELRELIAEKMALEQNTAEAISDNARFEFLVASCAFYENGNKVYNSLEEYTEQSDSEIAFAAATALAQMMYSIDKDFEANLPENKFLKQYHFVNDDLSLVNEKGETVDLEGRRINNLGQYINDEGQRTDKDGNVLDEQGNYVPSVVYVDDKGKKVNPEG